MKYQVPLRWFATTGGDEVTVVDERGRPAFRLRGQTPPSDAPPVSAPSSGVRVLTFRDRRGDDLAYVTRRHLSGANGGTAFEVFHGDDLQAVVRRDGCSPKRCRFMAEGPGPDDLHAEGDLAAREYAFTREGKTVGRVSRAMFGGTVGYGVEVGRGEDEVLLLASAAVIDLCCQPDADRTGKAAADASRMAG